MLHYSTLLVLIIRLKPFLHEINQNFSKKQTNKQASGALFQATDIFLSMSMTN